MADWRSHWAGVRRWVERGTEWVERMWLRDERAAGRASGEHRWTWIWLGKDATDEDIEDLVGQVSEEVTRLPVPLGIGDFMIAVTAWGPRYDGVGEAVYLEARQSGNEFALQDDLARRERPKVIPIGDVSRGHVIDREHWLQGRGSAELKRTLQLYRPSRRWRIVQVSLFSVGEAYLRLAAPPATTN